jgi:hypothetical protein
MSKQLNAGENLEDQLENLALQDNEVKPIDQQSEGAGVAQESSSKVSPIFFCFIFFVLIVLPFCSILKDLNQ